MKPPFGSYNSGNGIWVGTNSTNAYIDWNAGNAGTFTIDTQGSMVASSPPPRKTSAVEWLREQVDELCREARAA